MSKTKNAEVVTAFIAASFTFTMEFVTTGISALVVILPYTALLVGLSVLVSSVAGQFAGAVVAALFLLVAALPVSILTLITVAWVQKQVPWGCE